MAEGGRGGRPELRALPLMSPPPPIAAAVWCGGEGIPLVRASAEREKGESVCVCVCVCV